MNISNLISQHGIISDQIERDELQTILRELLRSFDTPGNVVEFGCYTGTTSLYIRRLLDTDKRAREYHVYDSFEGLPEKRTEDESPLGIQFTSGELLASKKQFIMEFKKAHLALPHIHKGWFSSLTPDDIPSDISFAFLDGDYFESIKTPLELITPKLAQNAVVVVDDYGNQALPGAKKATDQWCRKYHLTPRLEHSLAVINWKQ